MDINDIKIPAKMPEPTGKSVSKGRRRYERRKKKKPSWLMRLLRILILFIFIIVILLAIVVGATRTYLDANPELKLQMTERISARLGIPLASDDISIRWRWAGPQVTIDRLYFLHPKTETNLLEFSQAQVVLDVVRFIKTRTLGVSSIELQGAEFVLERLPDNELLLNQNTITEWRQLFNVSDSNADDETSFPNGLFNLEDIALVYKDRVTEQEIRLENVDLFVDKNDRLLTLDLNIDADQLADNISVSASTPNPDLHDRFEWQVLFQSDALRLSEITQQWQSLKPLFMTDVKPGMQAQSEHLSFSNGLGDIKLLLHATGTQVESMNGTFELSSLEFSRAEQELTSLVRDLGFRFSYETDPELTHFKVDKIQVSSDNNTWPVENNLELKLLKFVGNDYQTSKSAIQREVVENVITTELEESLPKIKNTEAVIDTSGTVLDESSFIHTIKMAELKATYLNLDHIAPVLDVFLQQIPNHSKIPDFAWEDIKGEISQLFLSAGSETQLPEQVLKIRQARAQFMHLGLPLMDSGHSVAGLDGSLIYSDDLGKVVLSSSELTYTNLNVFRNSLVFDKFETELSYAPEERAWRVFSENVQLENNDFIISSTLNVLLQEAQSPVLDIEAIVNPITLDNIKRYYPVKIMKPKLLNWLESGVSGGQILKAKFKLKGALADYPFRNGKGEFLVEHDLRNMDINYIPKWPIAKLHEAKVVYQNEGLEINATKVKTGGLREFPLKMRIADFKKGLFEIDIKTPIDMQKGRVWINNSPLKETIGKTLEHVNISGEAQSSISMQVPLNNVSQLKLQGQLKFSGNTANLDVLKEPLSNFSGTLEFTKNTLFSDNLQASYLGQLLKSGIETQNTETLISVHTDAQLELLLGKNYAPYISGISNLDALIRISPESENNSGGVQDINVRSNLLGASVLLPAPFAKSHDSLLPLDLMIDVVTNTTTHAVDHLRVKGSVGDTRIRSRLNAANINAHPSEREWLLHSITVVGGDNDYLFADIDPEPSRIHMLGEYSQVNFDEWLEFINQDRDSGSEENLEMGTIDITLDELVAIGQSFANARVVMHPNTDSWKAVVSNEQVNGTVTFPRPWTEVSRIHADLEKYHLILPDDDTEEISFDPSDIPNVSVTIQNFQYGELPLGETSFVVNRKNNGAELETFNIKSPTFSIDGNGGWYKTSEGETSLITLQLDSSDLTQTLKQLGYAPSASARSAEAMIELSWPTSPFGDILSELSGTVSFKLLNGELREVDPGAGRFLALLSIAQLPKRLSLDFRDVFNAGLGYDELSADFLLQGGQAYTNNMLMRGPVADLGVIGRIGLATRDFDQAAVVQADLGSSLPIAGALAGGLGVGAAMLIFSEIFKNPLKEATQVFYKIDGAWGDPQINRTPPDELQEVPIAPR